MIEMVSKGSKDEVELTEDQIQMVNDFMKEHPEADRGVALKFNLGRKFVKERVEECYKNYKKIVVEHHLEHITVADVLDELRTQKLYIPGTRDRNGAALFVINANKHIPGQFPPEQTLKFAFYLGEILTSNPKTSKIGITIISNMEGMEWANFDNQFQRNIINFFQNNIPARVKNIILYKSPWWVSMLVRMVSPFLKQKIRERIHFCDEGELLQFVEPDQLPKDLGGTYDYDHEGFMRREIAKVPSSTILGIIPKTSTVEGRGGGGVEVTDTIKEEMRKSPPPGTVMLVSDELAETLQQERQRVLAELDEKIRRRRESLKEHSLPLDISKVLRSKSARVFLDPDVIPSLEPNLLHLRNARVEGQPSLLVTTDKSPIAERPGEDYDRERLDNRIKKSILKDRQNFLKKMRRHATISGVSSMHEYEVPIEGEQSPDKVGEQVRDLTSKSGSDTESAISFTETGAVINEECNAPLVPTLKRHFSTLVQTPTLSSEVNEPSVATSTSTSTGGEKVDNSEQETKGTIKAQRRKRRTVEDLLGQRRRKTSVLKTDDQIEIQQA